MVAVSEMDDTRRIIPRPWNADASVPHVVNPNIAVVHIELILIHPFREVNGRLSRLLANVMALQAGWPELDYTPWDEYKTDYFAAIQAGLSDHEPMKGLVRESALRFMAPL